MLGHGIRLDLPRLDDTCFFCCCCFVDFTVWPTVANENLSNKSCYSAKLPHCFIEFNRTNRQYQYASATFVLRNVCVKIQERITYKIVSVTYAVLATAKPSYLSNLLTIPPARRTRSSKLITLDHPEVASGRTILNRSFRYSAHCGTLCQLNFAVLKTVVRRGQISYPNLHFCQNSRHISFTSPILAPPNLHLPWLHSDPTHLTWQIHGHLTNITS